MTVSRLIAGIAVLMAAATFIQIRRDRIWQPYEPAT